MKMKTKLSLWIVAVAFGLTTQIFASEIDITGNYTGDITIEVETNFPEEMLKQLNEEQRAEAMKAQGKHEINSSVNVSVRKVDSESGRKWKLSQIPCQSDPAGNNDI